MNYKKDFLVLEDSIRAEWRKVAPTIVRPQPGQETSYVLGMFPYPSGNAHMGHVRVFTISDVLARMERYKGKAVLHPLGWDAFGMPAENAAIKNKTDPHTWTALNIKNMRDNQLSQMGFSFDLAHEINTSQPNYYKWSQWLFLKMVKNGLVYRENAWVNWDPVDQTVLANEQVIDGKGWRSGVPVERRQIEQFHIRITDYAEALAQGVDKLDGWSDAAKNAQRSWIGRKEGALINFRSETGNILPIFTSRPELIYGINAIVLAPENPHIQDYVLPENAAQISAYIVESLQRSEVDRVKDANKQGVFTGSYVRHPITNESLPVYVAAYVLNDSATNGIICTPAHDQNDYALAQSQNMQIKPVIATEKANEFPYTEPRGTMINSSKLSGLSVEDARGKALDLILEKNAGSPHVTYRLRDWALGRQRFWGCPIPMAHDANGNWYPVEENLLPLELKGTNSDNKIIRDQESLRTRGANGETLTLTTDTMDTFMCSAWYVFRFMDPLNSEEIFDKSLAQQWLPVDRYVGGLEHANQHLIYLRFMTHFLYDMGLVPTQEPVHTFLDNGLIRVNGDKMSKSKGNEVRPDVMVQKYGADALRLFIMADNPYQNDIEWSESGVKHKQEFLHSLASLYGRVFDSQPDKSIAILPLDMDDWSKDFMYTFKKGIEGVEQDVLKSQKFHGVVATLHAMAHTIRRATQEASTPEQVRVTHYALQQFLKPLSLFAPHLAENLWYTSTNVATSIFLERWPQINIAENEANDISNVPIMINGRPQKGQSIAINTELPDLEGQIRTAFQSSGRSDTINIIKIINDREGHIKMVNLVIKNDIK